MSSDQKEEQPVSVAVELALAVAQVGTSDYFALIRALDQVIERLGLPVMAVPKGARE